MDKIKIEILIDEDFLEMIEASYLEEQRITGGDESIEEFIGSLTTYGFSVLENGKINA